MRHSSLPPGSNAVDHVWDGRTDLIDPLQHALSAFDDPEGRENASRVLGWIGDDSVASTLRSVMVDDPEPLVRRGAIYGVVSLDTAAAVPELKQLAVAEPHDEVRWEAARALGRIQWDGKAEYAATLLTEADTHVWDGFVTGIEVHPDDIEAVQQRLSELLTEDRDDDSLARLLTAVRTFDSVPSNLDPYLTADNGSVRAAAIQNVAYDSRVTNGWYLDRARDDSDPIVRAEAIRVCGNGVNRERLETFTDDPAAKVRRVVADKLARVDVPNTVPALVRLLEDEDATVRERAARNLGTVGHPSAVSALLDACEDTNPTVRHRAMDALKRIETDAGKVDASGFSLFDSRRLPTVDETASRSYDPKRASSVIASALYDTAQVPRVGSQRDGEQLRTSTEPVGVKATTLLARTTASVGETALSGFVLDWNAPPQIRARAVEYVTRASSTPQIEQAYHTALHASDPVVRSAAVDNIRNMNTFDTAAVLVEAISDDDPRVRETAANVGSSVMSGPVEDAFRDCLQVEPVDRVAFVIADAIGEVPTV